MFEIIADILIAEAEQQYYAAERARAVRTAWVVCGDSPS